jgi:hypothetical protein
VRRAKEKKKKRGKQRKKIIRGRKLCGDFEEWLGIGQRWDWNVRRVAEDLFHVREKKKKKTKLFPKSITFGSQGITPIIKF